MLEAVSYTQQLSLNQNNLNLNHRGHWAMVRDILGCTAWGEGTSGFLLVEARVAAKYSTMYRERSHNQESLVPKFNSAKGIVKNERNVFQKQENMRKTGLEKMLIQRAITKE